MDGTDLCRCVSRFGVNRIIRVHQRFIQMQKTRHELFQQIALALSHQQNGNATLAFAYWENVLRILPDGLQIQNEILAECCRISEENQFSSRVDEKLSAKLDTLAQTYRQELSDKEQELAQQIYRALCQQCGGNEVLAFAYWKNALREVSSDSLVITLAVQDFCWTAHQHLKAGHISQCITLYKHLLRTFPEFLEGYLNLSLILHKNGLAHEVLPVLNQIPAVYRQEFIVSRYVDLFQKIEEISQTFDHVPYAVIEEIVHDLRVENTFYPAIVEEYFTEWISELVQREQRFLGKRRKALEQKAIAKTSKQLAREGIALGQRVTMAKQAKSEDIHKFLHDNDIHIAEVLLNNPNLIADDVLVVAQTTYVSEILSLISKHHKWGTLHSIRMAILFNPQTLPQDAYSLLDLLNITDLTRVFYKKRIPIEVRIRAREKIQTIFQQLSLYEKIAVIELSSGSLLKLLDNIEFEPSAFLVNLIEKFREQPEIIANICRWKLAPAAVLAFIGNNSNFTSDIQILFALLSNPKTPAETVKSLLQKVPPKDVQHLLSNRYLPPSVKQTMSTMFPNLFP